MKAKTVNFEQQCNIAERFIIHNTNEKHIPINYKMTSQTWADVISKWSGTQISIEAVNEVMADLNVERTEIATGTGIFVFACAVCK